MFGIYCPKVSRASSCLMRCLSSVSVEALSWSASSKNLRLSASLDSKPDSIRSTRTRFALVCCLFARAFTCFASRLGSETLCRSGFSTVAISQQYTPQYTNVHPPDKMGDLLLGSYLLPSTNVRYAVDTERFAWWEMVDRSASPRLSGGNFSKLNPQTNPSQRSVGLNLAG